MSDKATSSDVMKELHALRGDVHRQGQDLRRLLDQHNEHERRIAALEPMRDSFRDLVECNDAILRELGAIRSAQEDVVNEMSRKVEASLRTDLLDFRRDLRTELAAVRMAQDAVAEAQQRLTTALLSRPCIVADDGECKVK